MTTRRSPILTGAVDPTLPRLADAAAIGSAATEPLPVPASPDRGPASQLTPFANHTLLHGRYCIEQLLGHGGMGAVYLATDRLDPRQPVALKTILARDLTPTLVQLFINEFKVLSLFSHQGLVKVYDFDILKHEEQHFYYFTMEYVDGSSLFVASQGKTYRELAPLFIQICEVLQYVHGLRIVHGDLKPGNILVTREGRVKLLDFGVSAQLGSQLRDPMGTPIYLAPEVITGGPRDVRVDIYGLGVILYEIVCGHSPFDSAADLSSIVEHKLGREIEFSTADEQLAPAPLRELIARLCRRDPAQRLASIEDVVTAFNLCCGTSYHLPSLPTPHAAPDQQEPFSGRERELAHIEGFLAQRLREPATGASLLLIRGAKHIGKSRLLQAAWTQARARGLPAILLSCTHAPEQLADDLAKQRPCAIFLDDLQAAPRETIRFLENVLRSLAERDEQEPVPLALVAACATRDLPDELAGLLEQAQNAGWVESMRLGSRWAVV